MTSWIQVHAVGVTKAICDLKEIRTQSWDEQTVRFYDPVQNFWNSPRQAIIQEIFKCEIQVQKFNRIQIFNNKNSVTFSKINSVQIRSWS